MQRERDKRTSHPDSQLYLPCHRTHPTSIAEARASHCDDGLCPPCQQRQRGTRSNARPSTSNRRRKSLQCPAFCIFQVVASLFITIFIMGLPLGDPNVECPEKSSHSCCGTEISKCFVCYVYNVLLSVSLKVNELLGAFQKCVISWLITACTVLMEFLHQIKMQIYKILQHVDGKDFCETCNCTYKMTREDTDDKSQLSSSKMD